MHNVKQLPPTVKRSIEIMGLVALGYMIVLGQDVIMPLLMAFFIAIMLMPLFRWFRRRRMPEALAIACCIITFMLMIVGIFTFLSIQVGGFVSDIDTIKQNLMVHWQNLSAWITDKTHYTVDQQLAMITSQGEKLGTNVTGQLRNAAASLTGIFIFLGLIPIYVFLIMFYRNLLMRFVYYWFSPAQHENLKDAAHETEVMVKYYLFGLLIQISYITFLLSVILLCLGVKHAVLIGITFAILNLIPYLGALIGNLIGVLLTLTTSQELWQVWAVLIAIAAVQFLDNNILMPRIVGSRVKVNALASIVGIVIGGAMAGISGMFLSIPIMAMLKIVFDRSVYLKQWGILLGDERPEGSSPDDKGVKGMRHNLEEKRNKEIENETDEG